MQTKLIQHPLHPYVELLPDEEQIRSERDVLDLLGELSAHPETRDGRHSSRLMLHAASLPEEFFDLKTGLAGAVLQKLVQYLVKTAAVIPTERVGNGRFHEMALEANRGNRMFHIFDNREQAETWLTGE